MSKNQLNFIYFAFSDEGVDYSGSLATVNFTGSIDSYLIRNMSFEETQRKNIDFSSYLYTIPAKTKQIPEFVSFPAENTEISLKRTYTTVDSQYYKNGNHQIGDQRPIAVIARATIPSVDRQAEYVRYQSLKRLKLKK